MVRVDEEDVKHFVFVEICSKRQVSFFLLVARRFYGNAPISGTLVALCFHCHETVYDLMPLCVHVLCVSRTSVVLSVSYLWIVFRCVLL